MSNNFQQKNNDFFAPTTLDKAEAGANYTVTKINLLPPLDLRFAELGFVSGAKVRVNKKAPLGDPLEVTVMGYSLCVRANEAKRITIERERK